jgi:hypothetical protein
MQAISDTISSLHLGEAETFEGLTIIPLLGEAQSEPDYITLDEALEQKTVRVLEVSESGDVPNLLFDNQGDSKVLLVDGDELVGAKQNRIINLTILVAAHSQVEIPVSCVEAGRWAYRSREFESLKRSMYSRARAAKADHVTVRLRRSGERYANQAEVWDNVSECSMDLNVDSPTGSMGDIFDQYEKRLKGYREAFQAQAAQVGAVFAVDGKVQGIEVFEHTQPFSRYLERLVESYAVDAMRLEKRSGSGMPSEAATKDFLEQVRKAKGEAYAAIGIGEDLRLTGEHLAGGALIAEDRVVHLAAFSFDKSEEGDRVLRSRRRSVH